MTNYNRTRRDQEILERAKNSPSFTVHLHPEHWTLNNGGKFLYNNQIASLLDDIRAYRIPVDFLELFEAAKVPFYDGCMVVELWDHRPQRPKEPAPGEPEKTQVVLHPNSETLWADLCTLNQRLGGKWTDQDALEIEARILLATTGPLCLDPDPHLTRMANHILKVTTPSVPVSLKRKAAALEPEEDETDKARRTKIMQYMAPPTRSHAPNYKVLDNLHKYRQAKAAKPPTPAPVPPPVQTTAPPAAVPTIPPPIAQYVQQASQARQSSATPSTPNPNVSQMHSPAESEDAKKRAKLKVPISSYPKSQTPVPQPATHQFIHQQSPNRANPSPSPSSASPLQPQMYANVHAAEAAKRASTPAQVYASPRPPTAIPPVQQPPHQPQQRPPSVAPYPSTVPNPHFPPQPTRTISNSQKSPAAPTAQPAQAPPQQQQTHPAMQAMYAQQYSQHAQQQQLHILQQQRLAAQAAQQKNGRATPQAVPVKPASPAAVARGSPIVTNQPIASRSPMPQPQSAQQPMTSHPPPHPHVVPYPYTHMRGITHQQLLQAQLASANGARPTASPQPPTQPNGHPQQGQAHQQHQQHQQHQPVQAQPQQQQQHQPVQQNAGQPVPHPYPPQVYSYAQMGFPQGRLPPSYWSVNMAGRVPGLPMTAQPIPGMPGTAQQLNAKAVPNGISGR